MTLSCNPAVMPSSVSTARARAGQSFLAILQARINEVVIILSLHKSRNSVYFYSSALMNIRSNIYGIVPVIPNWSLLQDEVVLQTFRNKLKQVDYSSQGGG